MAGNEAVDAPPAEIFKALGDPIRWSILAQIAEAGELACTALEDTLPVSKPTISYHTKILQQAELISVRKTGRNYYYSLRDEVIHDLLDALWELAPAPRPVLGNEKGSVPKGRRQRRNERAGFVLGRPSRVDRGEDAADAAILTW
jgi:DNA-binding transcriptional ArsR family regulator